MIGVGILVKACHPLLFTLFCSNYKYKLAPKLVCKAVLTMLTFQILWLILPTGIHYLNVKNIISSLLHYSLVHIHYITYCCSLANLKG